MSHTRFLNLFFTLVLIGAMILPTTPGFAQENAPAALAASAPANGASWSGEKVIWTFDQSVAVTDFAVQPPILGDFSVEGATVVFSAIEPPQPEVRYRFSFVANGEGAPPANVNLTLVGASPLLVTATQPSNGATEVATDSQIVVAFNRPVVPLMGIEEQADLPQLLTFTPPVDGQGEWLNTSMYAFRPTLGLAGATAYEVTVAPVTAVGGEKLDAPVIFGFTTAAPIVVDSQPQGNQAAPDAAVRIAFSQPMDRASSEAAFSLTRKGGEAEDGVFAWDERSMTLTFTPTQPLAFGEEYVVRVDQSAQPASKQGNLRMGYEREFRIVPLPRVLSTNPSNGAVNTTPDATVVVRFNAPLSRTLVMNNIAISPLLTNTTVYSYYNEYDNELRMDWVKEPQTTYTITLGAAIGDNYGNTFGEDYTFSFTTGDYSPFVRIDLDRYTHFSAITTTLVSVLYRNMEELQVELLRLPLSEFYKLNGENQWELWDNYQAPDYHSNLVWSRTYTTAQEANLTSRRIIRIEDADGQVLSPGLYLLQVKRPPGLPPQQVGYEQAVLILSNHNLVIKKSLQGDSLAWLTDLISGEPVSDQPVSFVVNRAELGGDVTDADGVVRQQVSVPQDAFYLAMIAVAGEPGDEEFAIASSDWNNGVAIWDFGLNGGYVLDPYQSFYYTDRPIYRPGQTVYWKGIVRQLVGDNYQLPPANLPVSITIRNDRGETVSEQQMEFSDFGTVNDQIELAPDAMTGYYYIEARIPIAEDRQVYGGVGFQVASYRKPEFEITLTPAQPEYTQGDAIRVTVQANYFSGGPLANAPLTWRLIADPYYFNWEDAPANRYYSFTPYDPEQYRYDPYAGRSYIGLVHEGVGMTGADGSFVISLPADLGDAIQSQRWTIDATVQSPTNQFVTGMTSFPVHRGDFYVGLSPQSYVSAASNESMIDVATVSPQGEAVGGVDLTMQVYEFKWSSVYEQGADGRFVWKSSVERTPVVTSTLRTDSQGAEIFTWTPPRGGQYQVIAAGQDAQGNAISSALFVYASDADAEAFIAWPRENNDRMELVADKRLYAPGDTARILTPNPFQGAVNALISIERAGVIEHEVRPIVGSSAVLEIPITEAQIPNIFVSVILVKGIDETNPTAAMRVGYAQLNVDTAAKELNIDVQTSVPQAEPGETVHYTLTVTDQQGEPVAAEVSVAVIDKALLVLAQSDARSLVEVFYFQRPLGVATGASLIINRDRLSQQLSEGGKGGGGGGGGGLEVREDFPDTAFWRADFAANASGVITFSLPLPDNLTTWRLNARGVTEATLVGDATHDLIATKALQVRPLLPRFFTQGDRAQIGAAIINTTGAPAEEGELTIAVSGATVDTQETIVPFTLQPGETTRFDFPISVDQAASSVVVTFTAQATGEDGALTDAVRMTLPIMRYETPEVVATAGSVPAGSVTEAILIPQEATDQGEMLVTLEPSLAAGMIDGLDYLKHYEFECNEQTVSRFLPNLFTVRALRLLEINNSDLEADLAYQLGVGVQRLVSRQNADGGWGYWPREESNPFITSYVLWGLWNAAELGYTVPESAIDRGVAYLDRSFVAPADVQDDWRLNELAFTHFVLSEIGDADPGRMSTLFDVRERLQHYGRAYLALALHNVDPDDARLQTLLDDLLGAATLSATGAAWQETAVDWRTLNTDARTTAIVLDAFARINPDEPLLPAVVRWLMFNRTAGVWSNTQENAWSIIGLTDWMVASGELDAAYDWQVDLNGEELGSGAFDQEQIDQRVQLRVAIADLLRDEANLLRIARSDDPGQLYYTTHLRYYLDALAIEPRDRGIVVERRFDAGGEAVNRAAVGDIISVTTTIIAPTNLYHVRVDTPIPAGVEPIDPSLGGQEQQYDESGNPIYIDNPWGVWSPTYRDFRDEKVSVFFTYLPAGAHQVTFQIRASTPGEYRVLPVYGELMYFTEVWGRSGGSLFTVTE
jgi:hypothetical protein